MSSFQVCLQCLKFRLNTICRDITQGLVMSRVQNPRQRGNLNLSIPTHTHLVRQREGYLSHRSSSLSELSTVSVVSEETILYTSDSLCVHHSEEETGSLIVCPHCLTVIALQ